MTGEGSHPISPLEHVYREHRHALLRFLTARTGDAGEAEDLLQDLWLKCQQHGGEAVANGRAYLFRMAQNLVVDRVRERQRRMQRDRRWQEQGGGFAVAGVEQADSSRNAEEAMLDREEAALLASAIGNLPDGARRAFQLHKIEGLSHGEVAARLGISKSGVEKHLAVAMKYLRRAFLD